MKFKINYSASPEQDEYFSQAQDINNTQASYISRGQDHPLALLLRDLLSIINRQDEENQNLLLMMEMDQEMGSISIGLIRRSAEHQPDKYKPDQASTISAIMQYEQSQNDLTHSLRQNLLQVKRNKLFYKHWREHANKLSALVLANRTIMDLIPIQAELPSQYKIRTSSTDTAQNSVFEVNSARQLQSRYCTSQQKASALNSQLCDQKLLQVQFQELEC